jgi:hypothetical protein
LPLFHFAIDAIIAIIDDIIAAIDIFMPLLMISHYAIIISILIRHYDIDCH